LEVVAGFVDEGAGAEDEEKIGGAGATFTGATYVAAGAAELLTEDVAAGAAELLTDEEEGAGVDEGAAEEDSSQSSSSSAGVLTVEVGSAALADALADAEGVH